MYLMVKVFSGECFKKYVNKCLGFVKERPILPLRMKETFRLTLCLVTIDLRPR